MQHDDFVSIYTWEPLKWKKTDVLTAIKKRYVSKFKLFKSPLCSSTPHGIGDIAQFT